MATNDGRLVAFDARTGKVAWDVRVANPRSGFTNSSGPIVARGKVIQGLHGCDRFRAEGALLHQRLRRRHRQAAVEVQHHRAHRRDPAATRGAPCPTCVRAGGDTWIAGSYDPDLDLTYWGIAQAKPWMPVSRGNKTSRRGALHRVDRGAARRRRIAGVAFPAHAGRVARSRRSVREGAGRHRPASRTCSPSARPACCGRSIARPASSSATSTPCSRTCSRRSIRSAASRPIAPTSSTRRWTSG